MTNRELKEEIAFYSDLKAELNKLQFHLKNRPSELKGRIPELNEKTIKEIDKTIERCIC